MTGTHGDGNLTTSVPSRRELNESRPPVASSFMPGLSCNRLRHCRLALPLLEDFFESPRHRCFFKVVHLGCELLEIAFAQVAPALDVER